MSTIKTWSMRLEVKPHNTEDEIEDAMQAEITELREALRVAQTEIVNRNQRALDGDKIVHRVNELCSKVEALQAKQIEAQEPVARVDDLERGGRVRALALGLGFDQSLYATPVAPAQPVNELVEELNTIETDAHIVFNNPPGEASQQVRDVIEWYAASVRTVLANAEAAQKGVRG